MAKNDRKQPFLKYYHMSLKMGKIVKIWTLIFLFIFLLRITLLKGLSKIVHFIQDSVKNNPNGYLKDLFPKADKWGNKFDNNWLFDLDSYIRLSVIISIIIIGIYMVLILLRHRNGEHAPLLNDLEAYKIKKTIIIKSTEATFRKKYKDENKKIKKRPRNEVKANRRIRDCEVEIHTFNKKGMSKPFKTYRVAFKRLRNDKANSIMYKKIQNIHENLNAEIDASFSNLEPYGGYYTSSVEKQLDKEKKSFIVKLRERRMQQEEEVNGESEFSFDLDKFKDRTTEIEVQKEKAKIYAEELQEALNIHITSKGINADKTEYYVENTSAEFIYTLPPNTTRLPNTEELEKTIDTTIDVEGSRVKLKGRKMVVTIPLPENYIIPIDVKTMMEAIF